MFLVIFLVRELQLPTLPVPTARYATDVLTHSPCTYGLLVVGWTLVDGWDGWELGNPGWANWGYGSTELLYPDVPGRQIISQ